MRVLLIISIILATLACNQVNTNKQESTEQKKPSIDGLTVITLPFSCTCGTNLSVYDKDSINNFVRNIEPNLEFGGLLKTTNKYSALLLIDRKADYQ